MLKAARFGDRVTEQKSSINEESRTTSTVLVLKLSIAQPQTDFAHLVVPPNTLVRHHRDLRGLRVNLLFRSEVRLGAR